MMILASLFPNPLFHELKLILHRCKKCDRAQTSASPTEQARRARSGHLSDLFAGCLVNFCNFISNVCHESRFIALASMWNRCQKRGVGFDEQPLQRQLADDLTLLLRVFIRNGSCNTNVEIEFNRFLRGFKVAIKGMEYTWFFCQWMIFHN